MVPFPAFGQVSRRGALPTAGGSAYHAASRVRAIGAAHFRPSHRSRRHRCRLLRLRQSRHSSPRATVAWRTRPARGANIATRSATREPRASDRASTTSAESSEDPCPPRPKRGSHLLRDLHPRAGPSDRPNRKRPRAIRDCENRRSRSDRLLVPHKEGPDRLSASATNRSDPSTS